MTREEAIDYLQDARSALSYKFGEVLDMAIESLSADAVHGEWIPCDLTFGRSIWACSVCDNGFYVPCDAFTQKPIYDYCPNCGADMRGDEK